MPGKKLREEVELFYTYLRQNGLKRTHQKDLILTTFLSTEGHLSVEDLHALVRRKDRKVGVVTVFRTAAMRTSASARGSRPTSSSPARIARTAFAEVSATHW